MGAQAHDGHRQGVGVEQLGEAPLASRSAVRREPGPHVDQCGQDARATVDDQDVGVGDRHDLPAVLRAEACLDVANRATRAELGQPGLALARIDPDGDLGHGPADDLVAGVAGGVKKGVVDFDDPTVVESGDGENGRAQLEDRLKPRGPRGVHHAGSLRQMGARQRLHQAMVAPGGTIHTLSASRCRRPTSSAIRRGGSSYGSRARANVPQ